MSVIRVADLLGDLEVENNAPEEDAVVLDAIVVYRVQKPDDNTPSVYYTQSPSPGDETTVGCMLISLDHMREKCRGNWIED